MMISGTLRVTLVILMNAVFIYFIWISLNTSADTGNGKYNTPSKKSLLSNAQVVKCGDDGQNGWNNDWDRRDLAYKNKQNRKEQLYSRHLFFVVLELKKEEDNVLNKRGRMKVNRTVERLKQKKTKFDQIFAAFSPMAEDVAKQIQPSFPNLEIYTSSLLKTSVTKYSPGSFTKEVSQEDALHLDQAYQTIIHRADNDQKRDTNEIIIAYPNVITYFIIRALQLPFDRWSSFDSSELSLTHIEILPDGRVIVHSFREANW